MSQEQLIWSSSDEMSLLQERKRKESRAAAIFFTSHANAARGASPDF
jgi:hypothetical protein